jgi:hypothetical protein
MRDRYMTSDDDPILPDLELEPLDSEHEDSQSSPVDYQIATYPADYTLEVLYQFPRGAVASGTGSRWQVGVRARGYRVVAGRCRSAPVPSQSAPCR